MKRFLAVWMLVVALAAPLSLWAACPLPNINNPNAVTVQGPGPDGGYPLPVTTNTGCPLDVTSSGGLSACVTQCTSPWISGIEGFDGAAWQYVGVSVNHELQVQIHNTDGQSGFNVINPSPMSLYDTSFAYALNGTGQEEPLRTSQGANGGNGRGVLANNQLLFDTQSATYQRQQGAHSAAEDDPGYGTGYEGQAAVTGFNSSFPVWSPIRTPTRFKTVATAAAGNTALWTPAAGKKFRLMRYMVTVVDQATQATPGTVTVSLFDGAAGATGQVHDVFVPALGLVNNGTLYSSGWIDLGNGYLSTAANNVLNINLSAALTAGTVRVICAGTEE